MNRVLVFILAIALALVAPAALAAEQDSRPILTDYNVSSTSFIYLVLAAEQTAVGSSVTTAGASTTVSATTGTPFSVVAIGDEITFFVSGATGLAGRIVRSVLTKTSSTEISVSGAAITLPTAGTPFSYRKLTGGTGEGDGWFSCSGFDKRTITWRIKAIAAASIEMQVQTRGSHSAGDVLNTSYPPVSGTDACGLTGGSHTGVGACGAFIGEPVSFCRLGIKVTGDAGTQSVSAQFEGWGK